MRIEVSRRNKISVVLLHGDIKVKTVVDLKRAFETLETLSTMCVAIDLRHVGFIDSSGIGILANFAKRLGKQDKKLCLFNYSDEIKDLLDITGIDQAVPLFDTFDQISKALDNETTGA